MSFMNKVLQSLKLQFLGYNISPDAVSMDEGKVMVVWNWSIPKSIKDLQRFLANFYRQFI